MVNFSSRTPSYLDLVFISMFDPILFHFGIDHGAFDDHVLLLIFRLFCYFSVGPTICYRAVHFLWIALGASFKNLSIESVSGDEMYP